jgi:hypothetical protein
VIPGPFARSRRAAAFSGSLFLAAAALLRAEPPDRPRPTPVPGAPLPYELLGVEQAVLLDGKPFPLRSAFPAAPPAPRRTLYAKPSGTGGDGSEARPWADLQAALAALVPGDRLVLLPGIYTGAFRVDSTCRNGKSNAWIQVLARKATLRSSGDIPALVLARGYWRFDGLAVSGVEGREAPLVGVEAGAEHVLVNRAVLKAGSGSGLAIGEGARHVTIANSRVTGLAKGAVLAPATAVDVRGGASDVTLANVFVVDSMGTGIRIGASETRGAAPPEDVAVLGATVRDSWGPAVWVLAASGLRLSDSDLLQTEMSRVGAGEGFRLESGKKVRLEKSHLRDFALAVRVGVAGGDRPAVSESEGPQNVSIERNYVDTRTGRGAGIAIEAGEKIQVSNNVLEGISEAFVLFGKPPRTRDVVVANNVSLAASDLAFRIEDPSTVSVFDRNFFSPARDPLAVEFGSDLRPLSEFLSAGKMPGTRIARGLRLRHRDLARIDGLTTVDAGWKLKGLSYLGASPDLGVAER